MITPVLLARIQFAMTVGFHFLFPPMTLGIALIVLILETLHVRAADPTDQKVYRTISSFFVKILGLIFAVGVATGITMEFAFGTNWAQYSKMVGDIFGAPLAAEAVFSFFLESAFMGVLVFGRNRVSKRAYWMAAFLVCFGAHLSGLWILIANSWMQTPAGFEIRDGVARLTDFFAAALNFSTRQRFTHTILGGWITGGFLAAGICAWYLLKGLYRDYAKAGLRVALGLLVAAGLLQVVSGHGHSVQVALTQPAKMAAYEGLWDTCTGAPLSLFGYPDASQPSGIRTIGFPGLLSFLIGGSLSTTVRGLSEFQPLEDFERSIAASGNANPVVFNPGPEVRPPVMIPFFAYHTMIMLGGLFAVLALAGIWLWARGRLFETRWYLWTLLLAIPLPHIANQAGWMAAEVGRQPWAVYRVLATSHAASVVVSSGQIVFSLIGFGLLYTVLFVLFITLLLKIIHKGPERIAAKIGY
jgi:cytochrome d ubiquinol oxidase subunit I